MENSHIEHIQLPNGTTSLLMVAGEASADLHGSMVVRELKRRYPDLLIYGIGGPLMAAEGFECIATSAEISVMGLTEVVMALPRIIGVGRRLLAAAEKYKTKTALLLDLPDFNLRLAKYLKKRQVAVLYYISPQVWAWRQGRVKTIKKLVDEMLVILPFEQEFYARYGVPAVFVGHPLVEEQRELQSQAAARGQLELPATGPVVALLPGSRNSEVSRHLPRLLAAAQLLKTAQPDVQFVLPVATPSLQKVISEMAATYGTISIKLLDGQAETAILASNVVAVCSGTATLQTALLGRPMVVFYRLSQLSYLVLRRLIKVGAISLVNLIAGRPLVKELIQDDFTPESLAGEIGHLLNDKTVYEQLQHDLSALRQHLGEHQPSVAVADKCAEYLFNSERLKGALNE